MLVGELLDALDATFKFPVGNARKQLGRVHRLQAFSPAYSMDPGRSSSVIPPPTPRLPGCFARARIPRCIPVRAIARSPGRNAHHYRGRPIVVLQNPARWFAQKRLGTYTGHDRQLLDDTERFVIDGLDEYSLNDRLLNLATGQPPEADWGEEKLREVLLAEGSLPHGPAGAACCANARSRSADSLANWRKPD